MRYEIHVSDIRSFKSCRRKWNWSSPLRGNMEPNVPYPPFFTGRAIHYALEMYYSEGVPVEDSLELFLKNEIAEMEREGKLWPAEKISLDDSVKLIRGMLMHYITWVKTHEAMNYRLGDQNLEFIATEKEFAVPLYNPDTGHKSNKIYLAGRFDGLVRNKADGTFWVWETKTTRSVKELEASLANDEQCGAYIYAAQQLYDVPVVGVMYNLMRKKIPTEPQVLNSGMLSKNKSIDTTAEAYMAAIRRQHPDWRGELIREQYGDILQSLLNEGNTFFARVAVYRTPQEITQLSRDLWTVGLEMTRPSTPLYPTPSWLNCNFCAFKGPCLALNAGADYEFLLKQEYRPRVAALSWRYAEDKEL